MQLMGVDYLDCRGRGRFGAASAKKSGWGGSTDKRIGCSEGERFVC